jgi:hypothetical protein
MNSTRSATISKTGSGDIGAMAHLNMSLYPNPAAFLDVAEDEFGEGSIDQDPESSNGFCLRGSIDHQIQANIRDGILVLRPKVVKVDISGDVTAYPNKIPVCHG